MCTKQFLWFCHGLGWEQEQNTLKKILFHE